jgi:hypothetical protein
LATPIKPSMRSRRTKARQIYNIEFPCYKWHILYMHWWALVRFLWAEYVWPIS